MVHQLLTYIRKVAILSPLSDTVLAMSVSFSFSSTNCESHSNVSTKNTSHKGIYSNMRQSNKNNILLINTTRIILYHSMINMLVRFI